MTGSVEPKLVLALQLHLSSKDALLDKLNQYWRSPFLELGRGDRLCEVFLNRRSFLGGEGESGDHFGRVNFSGNRRSLFVSYKVFLNRRSLFVGMRLEVAIAFSRIGKRRSHHDQHKLI